MSRVRRISWFTVAFMAGLMTSCVLSGCGFKYLPTEASDPIEEELLKKTALFAGVKNLQVHGEITETITDSQKVEGLVGWYDKGVAWYWRPAIMKYVSLSGELCPEAPRCELAVNIAAHEVCHAVSAQHDPQHWECSASLAKPTYPRPTILWTGPAYERLR